MIVIGSAQAVNILISIVRMKALALLLGPTGVGLLSIYNSLLDMGSTVSGLGMGSSGVRQIASAKGEEQALSRVRRVLLAAHLAQGTMAMLAIWLLRAPIAEWLFADRRYATEVGLIGLAVLLSLLVTAQTSLLQGMRRIADLGRVTVLSALAGSAAGLAAVSLYGQAGLVWFVVAQPMASLLIALRYTRRLPRSTGSRPSAIEMWEVWKPMVKLGTAFMLCGLATTATLLIVRSRITQTLGLDAAGHFAAAWGITMTYVGFLLTAMAADYYPRLTEIINDSAAATRLINDQAQLSLAIGGPVLLLLIGLAPWVIKTLYSDEFLPAVELLQWQTVGNVFKITSWALAFSTVAAARSKIFFLMELSFNIVFLALVWLMLPVFGLVVTAVAFLVGYMVYFAVVNTVVHTMLEFRWQPLSLKLLALHVTSSLALLALARTNPLAAAVASSMLAFATGVLGLRIVLIKMGREGRIAESLTRMYAALGWPIRRIT